MTESIEPSSPSLRRWLLCAAGPFALAAASAGLCYAAAGTSLGLLFGGLIFAALLAPPLVLSETCLMRQCLVAAGIADGIAMVWLAGVFDSAWSVRQWLTCYLLLAAWVAALGGLVVCLWRCGLGRITASAAGVVLAILWLTWPVWLSPWLNGRRGEAIAAWLTPPHPMMAINAVVQDQLGIWSQQTLAYHLTNLGQHVAYTLPGGIAVAATVHLTIGLALGALAGFIKTRSDPT